MKTCIALDIESTGFDTSIDQVIEIAAVKFEGDKIIDTFETFINPGIPIPPIINHITGIKDEDVKNAPTLESVKAKLEEFMGEAPIVGHNIDFDVNFLRAKGVSLTGPLYDTLQLSMILLPGLASYSLDTLVRNLKLKHENTHRAMSDTMACYGLFCVLLEKINEIDEPTLQQIQAILRRSTWHLREIFLNLEGKPKKRHHEENTDRTSEDAIPYQKTAAEILESFGPNGKLDKIVKNYEARPSQQQMTELIIDALTNHKKKLIEAGTGVGKTMAYLMAAIHHSLSRQKKIVISTYTHTLQEQLLKKDVPLLKKLFEPSEFQIAALKGRRNYLSYKRLELLMQKDFFHDAEVSMIIKIMLWLSRSQSGDLEELTFVGKEYSMLDEICCAEHACSHDDAEFKNGCYLIKARQKATNADIIVVNHALLLNDSTSENPILPEYEDLIVDEAHHLEKVATDTFTVVLAFHSFQRPFDKLRKNLDTLNKILKEANLIDENQTIKQTIEQLLSRIEIFFGLVGIFLEKNLGRDNYYNQINLSNNHTQSREWLQAKESAKTVGEAGRSLMEKLSKLQELSNENTGRAWKEIKGYMHDCEKKIADLKAVMETDESSLEQMTWVSKTYEDNVAIRRSPVDVGPMLNSILWNAKSSITLTSATLRTDHTFNFIRDQLGLGGREAVANGAPSKAGSCQTFEEAVLPSHFSYPDQVKIIIPEDMPEPATEGYFQSCATIIKNTILANGGRTLVLFTAKKALSATYFQVAPLLKKEGITVLAQQITGGRGKILEHFKDEPGTSAIFGTQSFWEGVDLQGNDLNCVIIQKLPFDPPDDPMVVARSKKYRDPFNEYQLPKAILKFKQGFGRLIRSSTDTGSIVILDTRIIQKTYGHQFLQSLPEGIQIKYGSKDNMQKLLGSATDQKSL